MDNKVELKYISKEVIDAEEKIKTIIKKEMITFEFPTGFNQIRLIEECRALNAIDVSIPDNFDLMYDITMQMIERKSVNIHLYDEIHKTRQTASFFVQDRFYNMRNIPVINKYPILINWLVERVAGYLSKKYPRSLEDISGVTSVKEDVTKKNPKRK